MEVDTYLAKSRNIVLKSLRIRLGKIAAIYLRYTNLFQYPHIPTDLANALVLLVESISTKIAWEENGLD
jgi:hypothetical protein